MTTRPVDILLVEDNPADEELTVRALRKHNLANNLVVVRDGVAALDFLFATGEFAGRSPDHPKLVLLDLELPKVEGIEVLRRMKADERTCAIPVVVLTSSGEDRDVVESYRLGVNSYVVKPVDFSDFESAVTDLSCYLAVARHPT